MKVSSESPQPKRLPNITGGSVSLESTNAAARSMGGGVGGRLLALVPFSGNTSMALRLRLGLGEGDAGAGRGGMEGGGVEEEDVENGGD